MKKVLIIAILALNVVSLSYLALSQSEQNFAIRSAIAEENEGYSCSENEWYGSITIDCEDSEGNHYDEAPTHTIEVDCTQDGGGYDQDYTCTVIYGSDPCTGISEPISDDCNSLYWQL